MSEERIAGPQDGTPAENDTPQRMPSEEYQHGLTHTGARDGFSPEEDCPGSDQTKTASGKIEIEPEIPPGNTSQDVIPQETILQPGTSQAKEIPDSGAQQDHPPMPKSTKDRPSDEIHSAAEPLETEDISGRVSTSTAALTHDSGQQDPPPALKSTKDRTGDEMHSAAEPLETEDISGRVSTSTAALTHDSGQQDPPPALKSTKDRTSDEMHSAAEPLETEDIPGRVSTSTAASIHDSGLQDHPPALKSTRDSPSDEIHSAAEPLETEDIPSRVSTSTAALTHDSDTPQSNAGSSPTPPALDARPGTELKELRSRVYSMLAAHHETQAVELLLCEVETRRKRMYDMKNLILKKMKIEEARKIQLISDVKTLRESLSGTQGELDKANSDVTVLKNQLSNSESEKRYLIHSLTQAKDEVESLRAKVKDLEVIVEKTLKDRERIGVLEKKLESDAAEIANLKETFRALEAEYAKKVEGLRLECERASKIIEEERAFYKAYSNRHTVRPNGDTAPTSELSNPTGELKEEILDLSCSLKEKIRNMEQEYAQKLLSINTSVSERLASKDQEIENLRHSMEVADCRRLEELSKKITNFSNQLEEKNIQIGDLKRKVINLKSQLAQHASDKNDHSGGDSSFFEKKLAKRLLLSILSGTKISDTKMDAAEKLASVLDFDSNETASIGLPSKQIEFSDTGNPPTIRRVSGPGTPAGGIDQSDNSFLDLWVRFLLKDIKKS